MSYIVGMAKKSRPKPTAAELELLAVLWDLGPSTVRQVHDVIAGEKETGYTTTLRILQKMTDKGLVRRDESQRSHIYRAAYEPHETRRQLVRDLLRRAFGGSPAQLVMQALSEQRATPEELAEIRTLLDKLESEQGRKHKP
jgi:predicted transcriptional regulator